MPCSDFLKVVMYHNVAGERMAQYIDNMASAAYGDVPKEELLEFHYRVLGYAGKRATGKFRDGIVECVRPKGNPAGARGSWQRAYAIMAGHRHRRSHRDGPRQMHSRGHARGSAGSFSRAVPMASSFPASIRK